MPFKSNGKTSDCSHQTKLYPPPLTSEFMRKTPELTTAEVLEPMHDEKKQSRPTRRQIQQMLLILVALCAACALGYLMFGRTCIFQIAFGMPCPGCGMLHAFFSLLTFHFYEATIYNPAIWIWIPFVLCTIFAWWTGRLKENWFLVLFGFVAAITIGIYIFRMITVFPAWPMDSYAGNLLGRAVALFR